MEYFWGFPGSSVVKNLCNARDAMMPVRSLGQEDPLEKEMTTHSSILPWTISWRKEPCKQQSIDRVEKSWTRLSN